MTNETILTFAFLAATYQHYGHPFRLLNEMGESDRQQHLITAQLFLDDPEITPKKTHEAWVARRKADGWSKGDSFEPEHRVHPHLVRFESLPEVVQEGEAAGVAAMRDALPYAQDNQLPPELEFEILKRIATENANIYLEMGDELGLDPAKQPSSMLIWGSLANVRHHVHLMKSKGAYLDQHHELIENGVTALELAMGKAAELAPATPGAHSDAGSLECAEDHLEHGRVTKGSVHLTGAFNSALNRASEVGYCDRCLVASQIGTAVSALVTGLRSEGTGDARIMAILSDIIAREFHHETRSEIPTHPGNFSGVLQ